MENKKFTDEEIVKALECCVADAYSECKKCKYGRGGGCTDTLKKDLLSLINRQKDEIKTWVDRYREMHEVAVLKQQQARAEAIKEFAERLKKEALIDSGYEVLQRGTIDRIAKELTEGRND